jgi:hypothetical protein
MWFDRHRFLVSCCSCFLLAAVVGCGVAPADKGLTSNGNAGGNANADGGAAGADGVNGPSASGGGGGSAHVQLSHAPGPIDPPGVYLTSESATASGPSPCGTTPLGDVLDAIRASEVTLADIQTIYNPATSAGDGSFIYAYDVGALGFDIVFKRGLGDCPAGCTENDYQYFSTDASCEPTKVGHYHTAWGTGTCLTVDGAPMWAHPAPPDPLIICGEDNSPSDLRGTYAVHAQGQRTPCAAGASASPLDDVVQLVIEQDAMDPSNGFVTFSSTGDPLVDDVRMPARFQRQRFDAALMSSFPPDVCPRATSITARYDFEGYQPGGIDALDFGDQTCGACKGSMSVALDSATAAP